MVFRRLETAALSDLGEEKARRLEAFDGTIQRFLLDLAVRRRKIEIVLPLVLRDATTDDIVRGHVLRAILREDGGDCRPVIVLLLDSIFRRLHEVGNARCLIDGAVREKRDEGGNRETEEGVGGGHARELTKNKYPAVI